MIEEYCEDGARLTVENGVGIIRFLKSSDAEDKNYEAICIFTPLSDKVVKISGMLGRMTLPRMRLLLKVLLYKGWSVVYAHRLQGRRLPVGKVMEDGDFAGWWRVDLQVIQKEEEHDNESRN